ncbi:unnamed protein product [Toxocara canis]|uniref:Overexpressed in colon carcinoma 1 protein n=1 Tax=Toxocara canis TaxID=6265 RepID=A0A183UVZ8_TOXCA|nr:unnamed protein product [Toxocara canis]
MSQIRQRKVLDSGISDTQHLSPAELSSSSGAKKVKYKDVDYGPVDEVKHCYGSNAGGAPGCVTADPRGLNLLSAAYKHSQSE